MYAYNIHVVIMHAYEVQMYYVLYGVLKRQLKLAVREGRFDLVKWAILAEVVVTGHQWHVGSGREERWSMHPHTRSHASHGTATECLSVTTFCVCH